MCIKLHIKPLSTNRAVLQHEHVVEGSVYALKHIQVCVFYVCINVFHPSHTSDDLKLTALEQRCRLSTPFCEKQVVLLSLYSDLSAHVVPTEPSVSLQNADRGVESHDWH